MLECRSFDKTIFSCFPLPPTQHHSFFRNKKFVYARLNPLRLIIIIIVVVVVVVVVWNVAHVRKKKKKQYISKEYIKAVHVRTDNANFEPSAIGLVCSVKVKHYIQNRNITFIWMNSIF